MDIINLLPDSIANQIAAGEVVQRPASVVKELLENSIDAGAKNISLVVKDAGKTLIQVIDDGIGMSTTDARMSFERHATSKIKTAEDLFKIKSMGFRGEALPSIAAVSQVDIKTRQAKNDLGNYLCIEASEIKKQEPIASAPGTSISVKNLFYNIPARRNFLKSNPVELRHITDEFYRVALANPNVVFTMMQNDLEVFHLTEGKLSQRVVGLFGKNYKEQLIQCHEETELVSIKGYIGRPDSAKKTRGEQFFFVNNRFIRNNYLNHAVGNAYEGLLPKDYFPFYVLFISIDPKHIDINVHPTKTEVKFDDERLIYGIVKSAVKQALGAHNISPSIDFGFDVNFESAAVALDQREKLSRAEKDYSRFQSTPREQTNLEHWSKLYDTAKTESTPDQADLQKEMGSITLDSLVNKESELTEVASHPPIQFHNQYILKQVKSGILLINQAYSHERILYEKYQRNMNAKSGTCQQFLFARQIELNPSDFNIVSELEGEIKSLGFDFEFFGKNAIVVHGIPSDAVGQDEELLFEGLIEQFKQNTEELSLDKKESLIRAIAKKSAIKAGKALSEKEMNSIIDQLFACGNPNFTPQGQATFIILDHQKLEGLFS